MRNRLLLFFLPFLISEDLVLAPAVVTAQNSMYPAAAAAHWRSLAHGRGRRFVRAAPPLTASSFPSVTDAITLDLVFVYQRFKSSEFPV